MARIFPAGWGDRSVSASAQREIETLAQLQDGLPDTYSVYHGVHWTQLNKGFSIFGEADFVVVSPSGRVLVIEQKSGFLEETPLGLAKIYLGKSKSVSTQLARTIDGMQGRFKAAFGALNYRLEGLLFCPDYRVRNPAIAGVHPERIVDANRRGELASIVEAILPADEVALPCATQIHAFLADELSLTPDAGAMIGEVSKLVTRVSGGLATWARSIEFKPFRLRVIGTAGSGKTQLAIRVLEDAARTGRRALYLCYNRPLADHLGAIAPPGSTVLTYHQLCESVAGRSGDSIDFRAPDVFARLEGALLTYQGSQVEQYDVVIVDEGQDFRQEWILPIERLLRPEGRFWWLEDPMQNLYARENAELPGWVEVRATSNYRSPRDVVRFIGRLAGAPMQIEAAAPFDESDVGVLTYAGSSATQATRKALEQAISMGFRPADIALLTFHGREKSMFSVFDRLGPYTVRSFTGAYDASGTPVYRDGDIAFDSVYRFKGQCAPCVILTEIDFERFEEGVFRRLFVGATRATMKLFLVMSDRAAGTLLERIGQ